MSDRTRGMFHKFNVSRTDGSSEVGGKHEDCSYFVLDMTHDPYAIPAIKAYAESCEAEYPLLARDLRRALRVAIKGEGDEYMSGTDIAEWLIQMANVLDENAFLKGRIEELEKSPDVIAMLNAANVMDSQSELITKLQQQVDAVKECQVYVVELDDCEIRWIKESDVLAALKIRTKQ